jgi:hypothetical protein
MCGIDENLASVEFAVPAWFVYTNKRTGHTRFSAKDHAGQQEAGGAREREDALSR